MTTFERRAAIASVVALLAASVAGAQREPAGDTPRFVGTWRLVSDTTTGIMIYDSIGNMAAQVMPNRVRRKYAAAEPTPEEAKDAITGYLAYFGTYDVNNAEGFVTHHIQGSLFPEYTGTDQIRYFEVDGERLGSHSAAGPDECATRRSTLGGSQPRSEPRSAPQGDLQHQRRGNERDGARRDRGDRFGPRAHRGAFAVVRPLLAAGVEDQPRFRRAARRTRGPDRARTCAAALYET